MKSFCLCLILAIFVSVSIAQEKPKVINSGEIITKGIQLYDDKKYEEAIIEFEKIPEGDTNYFASLVEQVLTYYKLEEYDNGVIAAKKALNMKLYIDYELYLNMGSCLDMLEKYEEAVKYYDEAIQLFPKNNFLYFNKAYSLSKLGKHKESFECLKKSAELNPFHAKTHLHLGVLAMNEGKSSLAMLAFNTFLILSPNSSISNSALVSLNDISSSKYQEKTEPKNIDITDGDDFSDLDMMIHNYIALDKKYKTKSSLTLPFVKQSYLLFEKLPVNPDEQGFWYKLYVPFYKQLLKEKKFDIYSISLLQASASGSHQNLAEKNKTKINAFYDWFLKAWDNNHRTYEIEFNGKKQEVSVYHANKYFAISSIGTLNSAKTAYIGYNELYHSNGRLKAKGNYNNNGLKEGDWVWYNENGLISRKENYKDGKLHTYYEKYNDLGYKSSYIPYKSEKANGEVIFYDDCGAKERLVTYKDDILDGKLEDYYSNGQISFKSTLKEAKFSGKGTEYWSSGENKRTVTYTDGKVNGEEIYYFRNGKISKKSTYTNGDLNGIIISYYDNGKTKDSCKYVTGKLIGRYVKYAKTGLIDYEVVYDESGKYNGILKQYTFDGKLHYELEYKKGEIIAYKFYDTNGRVIKEEKRKMGTFNYEGFYPNGNPMSKGIYGKEEQQGEWEYYNENGLLESTAKFTNGKLQGEKKIYYCNKKILKTINFKDDDYEGYYAKYYKNGDIEEEGNYKKGNLEGEYISYYPNKIVSSRLYYLEGKRNGPQKYYTINGKLDQVINYYKGVVLNYTNYDTLGVAIDSINIVNGTGKIVYHFYKSGPVRSEYNIVNNKFEGDYFRYYPNGNINSKGKYFLGDEHGKWEWYYSNGNIKTKGEYSYGDAVGKWEYFNENGTPLKTAIYEEDNLNGKIYYYNNDGLIEAEREYADGSLNGTSTFYSSDGKVEHKRYFKNDILVGYSYIDVNGAEKKTDIKNETADIKIFFKNEKIARQYSIINGWYEGEYLKYHPNGKLWSKDTYLNHEENGESTEYYSDGTLKEKTTYINGEINGNQEKYYSNGKIKEKATYVYGVMHGPRYLFDKNGKLTTVEHYFDDVLISITKK